MDVTRRGFLAAAVAAPQGRRERIIVIGGGLAGLAAAHDAQQKGYAVTVLEAQSRPGGRVRTLRDNLAVYVEAGAEQIPAAHEITIGWAKQLGLNLVRAGVPNTRSLYYWKGRRFAANEAPAELAGWRKQYIEAAVAEAQSAGGTGNVVKAMARWDAHKPGEWLRAAGAPAEAIDLLMAGFGAELGSAASYLLHIVNSMGGGPSLRVEGGNDLLPRTLATKVDDLRFDSPVASVRQDDRSVQVTLRNGQTLDADRVVCTLPCPAIGKILDGARLSTAKRDAIRNQSYSRTVKVFLQARSRFWLRDGFSGNVTTDLPIERLTPDPGIDAGARGAITAYPIGPYGAALEKMAEEERVAAALEQARRIFPEIDRSFDGGISKSWGADRWFDGGISKSWGADPWQRGAFALHTPGQIHYIETLARAEGRIHFAGEHTSAWTGWMQGALESARRVSREIAG